MLNKLRKILSLIGLKNFLLRVLLNYEEKCLLGISKEGYLYDIGYQKTLETKKLLDKNGEPLPWLVYSAINYLNKILTPKMTVFEYGAGSSTLWFSKRVSRVISTEHDKEWYEKVKNEIPSNCQINHYQLEYGGAYCKSINNYAEKFDVILIDGRDRVNCVKEAVKNLKSPGIIILDNSEVPQYKEAIEYLLELDFKEVEFIGLLPSLTKPSCTTFFFKDWMKITNR